MADQEKLVNDEDHRIQNDTTDNEDQGVQDT